VTRPRENTLRVIEDGDPTLSRDADNPARDIEQLTEALAARGFGIARVTADEAYASERRRAFVKEVGNRGAVGLTPSDTGASHTRG
jgi:hypothetical protein